MALKDRLKQFDLLPELDEERKTVMTPEIVSLCGEISSCLSAKIASIPVWFEYSEEEQKELILNFINVKIPEMIPNKILTEAEKEQIVAHFLNMVYGFGPLDFLIAKNEISAIIVDSFDRVYVNLNGDVIKSDVILDSRQYEALIEKLLTFAKVKGPVTSFRFGNLFVTIVTEPVSSNRLFIKKLSGKYFNFECLEEEQIFDKEISKFFKSLIASNSNILVSAPIQSGKTVFLNSILNELESDARAVLFEDNSLINIDNSFIERYCVGNISKSEKIKLIRTLLFAGDKFVFSDVDDVEFNCFLLKSMQVCEGFWATVCADSPDEAVSLFSKNLVRSSDYVCEPEQAAKLLDNFDYVVQLEQYEKHFIVKSISALSLSTDGKLVLNKILSFDAGAYSYNFPQPTFVTPLDSINVSDVPVKKNTFSSRFAK